MTRAAWDPETKARAIAIGRRSGSAAAESATGVPSATVRSWLRREVVDRATSADETRSGEMLAGQEATGALSDTEWAAIQRTTAQRYRTLLARGDTLGAQRLAIVLGITDTKLAEREERARGQQKTVGASSIARVRALRDELEASRRAHLSASGPEGWRAEAQRVHTEVVKLQSWRRELLAEIAIRRERSSTKAP